MSYSIRLEAMIERAKEVCREAETRFATIDWEAEFTEMDEDSDYSPLPFLTDADFYEKLECPETICGDYECDATAFMKKMRLYSNGAEPDKKIVELVNVVETMRSKTAGLYRNKLREEFMKGDLDLRPSIYCAKCNVFAMNVSKFYEHECRQTTKCNRCNYVAPTFERLENHMNAKHLKTCKHNCKECDYETDSPKEFERHNNSKAHKEKCGVKKEAKVFECKTCDKQYAFESDYTRHCLSVKHKKLSNV